MKDSYDDWAYCEEVESEADEVADYIEEAELTESRSRGKRDDKDWVKEHKDYIFSGNEEFVMRQSDS